MTAKMEAAWAAAEKGCTTVIANGKMTNVILHVSQVLCISSNMFIGKRCAMRCSLCILAPLACEIVHFLKIGDRVLHPSINLPDMTHS